MGYVSIDEAQYIYKNGIEGCIEIFDFTKANLLSELWRFNDKTKVIKLIDEGVIAKVLKGRVLESVQMDYKGMNEEQREMYLNVLFQTLNEGASGITSITEVKELCTLVILQDPKEQQPQNESKKATFIQKMRELIQQRTDPINDLIELYKVKIPTEFQFIYDETIANLERMIKENQIGDVSEELIRKISKVAPNNLRLQDLLSELLAKQYCQKGIITTQQFIENIYYPNVSSYEYLSTRDTEETYWKIRTEGYMRSLGKSEEQNQQSLLIQLQRGTVEGNKTVKTPQYIEYRNLEQIEETLLIGFRQDGTFIATTQEMNEMESDEELSKQQNKGKKGLRGWFKKKKDKEVVLETIVLEKKEDVIQAINRYETGRFEIVELSQKKFKIKVSHREDILPQDIGNNGGLILKKPIVDRVDVQYDIITDRNPNMNSRVSAHEYEK